MDDNQQLSKGWESYFARSNPILSNCSFIFNQLTEARLRLFSNQEKMNFEVLQISETPKTVIQDYTIESDEKLEKYIANSNSTYTTFISVNAINSITPLKITSNAMERLLSHHDIGPDFMHLLFYFANGHKELEIGPGSMISKMRVDASYDIQYRFNYVEETGKSWATRQIGVYHHWIPHGPGSTWIFLHPKGNSVVQNRLGGVLRAGNTRENIGDWFTIHLLVFSSYFGSWRLFIQKLDADIRYMTNDALSLNVSSEAHYQRGLGILREMHRLENEIIPLCPQLSSLLQTITSLRQLNENYSPAPVRSKRTTRQKVMISDELRSYETRLRGHIASVEVLEKRIKGVLNLLAAALNLRGQATALDMNKNIWSLTKDTVDDSATVRVMTVVTLVYLPGSFVSGLLGMNLFDFQSSNKNGFQISSQFWIFIVLTIPLTLVTVGYWFFQAQKQKKRRRKEVEQEILDQIV